MSAALKIFQQIPKVMQELEAVGKERDNKQQGFKFRGIDDFYNELHPRLAKHSIFTVPETLDERREERASKSGGVLTYVILKMKYTFFADDGSSISAIVVGEGMDTGDKATNKAMAIAHKYALMQVFAIPTEDEKDPDAESHELKPKQAQENSKPATKAAISGMLKAFQGLGISEAQVCGYLQISKSEMMNEKDIADLKRVGAAIKEGKVKIEDYFPVLPF